jgi:hypothetical protein
MQQIGRWDLAERHMETAYKRGADRPGFQTYQLDTNSLGLCLDLELQQPKDATVVRSERILQLLERMRDIIREGNHRGHVLKVLGQVETFVHKRALGLSQGERVSFVYHLNLLVSYLENLSIDEKVFYGSDIVRKGLVSSVKLLVDA